MTGSQAKHAAFLLHDNLLGQPDCTLEGTGQLGEQASGIYRSLPFLESYFILSLH